MRVRKAELRDLNQLCRVRNNERLFRTYLEECDGERAHFLVAEVDSRIVGFGLVYLDTTKSGKKKSHLPKLSDLYVAEEYRCRGVATTLVRAREALAKGYGYSRIYVSIDPDESFAMVALAKKLGYQPIQAEPYAVSAIYHDAEGRSFQKQYLRLASARTCSGTSGFHPQRNFRFW